MSLSIPSASTLTAGLRQVQILFEDRKSSIPIASFLDLQDILRYMSVRKNGGVTRALGGMRRQVESLNVITPVQIARYIKIRQILTRTSYTPSMLEFLQQYTSTSAKLLVSEEEIASIDGETAISLLVDNGEHIDKETAIKLLNVVDFKTIYGWVQNNGQNTWCKMCTKRELDCRIVIQKEHQGILLQDIRSSLQKIQGLMQQPTLSYELRVVAEHIMNLCQFSQITELESQDDQSISTTESMAKTFLEIWEENGRKSQQLGNLFAEILNLFKKEWHPSLNPLVECFLYFKDTLFIRKKDSIKPIFIHMLKEKLRSIQNIDDFRFILLSVSTIYIETAEGEWQKNALHQALIALVKEFPNLPQLSWIASFLLHNRPAGFEKFSIDAEAGTSELFFKHAAENYLKNSRPFDMRSYFGQLFPNYHPRLKAGDSDDAIALSIDLSSYLERPFSDDDIFDFLCSARKEIEEQQQQLCKTHLTHKIALKMAKEFPDRLLALCSSKTNFVIHHDLDEEKQWVEQFDTMLNSSPDLQSSAEIAEIGNRLRLSMYGTSMSSKAFAIAALDFSSQKPVFPSSLFNKIDYWPGLFAEKNVADIFTPLQKALSMSHPTNLFCPPEDPKRFLQIKEKVEALCTLISNHEGFFGPPIVINDFDLIDFRGCCTGCTLHIAKSLLTPENEDFENKITSLMSEYSKGATEEAFVIQMTYEKILKTNRFWKHLFQGICLLPIDSAIKAKAIDLIAEDLIAQGRNIDKIKITSFLKEQSIDLASSENVQENAVNDLVASFYIAQTLLRGYSLNTTIPESQMRDAFTLLGHAGKAQIDHQPGPGMAKNYYKALYDALDITVSGFTGTSVPEDRERLRYWVETAAEGIYMMTLRTFSGRGHALLIAKRNNHYYFIDPNKPALSESQPNMEMRPFLDLAYDTIQESYGAGEHSLSFFKIELK